MFTILVYKSRVHTDMSPSDLYQLVKAASLKNAARDISGVLLFDGDYFFQYLEGPSDAIKSLYEIIVRDKRHRHVVKLMEDHSPTRRFGVWSMHAIDVNTLQGDDLNEILAKGSSFQPANAGLPSHDRVLKMITAFASASWAENDASFEPDQWQFQLKPSQFDAVVNIKKSAPCQFAFQPILDPVSGTVASFEALIRSATGGPPSECFKGLSPEQLYLFDLESKQYAFELASQMNLGKCKISINLLPMSLVRVPNAVESLLTYITNFGFAPQQVIVEITEEESITNFEDFQMALTELRSAGISVAIDDFGAGFAGLTLLSRFQPEKLKIDRQIIEGIHHDGPKQAIVKAIIECAHSLGITIVAEGVETVEEWCWLESVGVDLFQGFLFAKPQLNGTPGINWPTLKAV
jgi:blue light- and temperature-responsive anti-repressor